jgi:hypothetical protein
VSFTSLRYLHSVQLVAPDDGRVQRQSDDELAEEEGWIDERSGEIDADRPPWRPRRSA